MLKTEFQVRSKVIISDECYEKLVEPIYNESDMPKDEWVKDFMKHGGMQAMYDFEMCRANRAERNEEYLKSVLDHERNFNAEYIRRNIKL